MLNSMIFVPMGQIAEKAKWRWGSMRKPTAITGHIPAVAVRRFNSIPSSTVTPHIQVLCQKSYSHCLAEFINQCCHSTKN
ncbi:hypothetical protein [Seinonella peptonophila]|uniref:hypothetical protein n=1 Tax=Seinonella peptonophila TaxID=112248 RepID=UPI001114DEF6|nr:hypothetical protein [Seinonella peptonophila]